MANTELRTRILIRNDVAVNWTSVNPKLSKGEMGIEIDTNLIKIGDGVKTWSELPYFKGDLTNYYTKGEVADLISKIDIPEVDLTPYYNKEEVNELIQGAKDYAKGLVDAIPETDLSGYYTKEETYSKDEVYNRNEVDQKIAEVTIDQIDADKVTFAEDLMFTQAFGKYAPDSSGSVVIPVATEKMSLRDLFEKAFSEEKDPETDEPTVTLTATGNSEAEVGTTFNMPVATLTVTDIGGYTYGPSDTGVRFAASSLVIKQDDKADHSSTNSSEYKSGNTITLTASNTKGNTYGDSAITYKFNATAKYTPNANIIPVTNMGTEVPEKRIGYGKTLNDDGSITLSVTNTPKSTTYTGFRKMFWGTMESKPDTLTSAQIRGLSGLQDSAKANGIKVAPGEKSLSIPVGAKRVVIAVPKGRTLSKVLDANDSNANIVGSFSSMEVDVEGNNSYAAKTYTVYYIDYANAATVTNTYKVTIA